MLKNSLSSFLTTLHQSIKKGLLTIFATSVLTNILGFISSTLVVRFVSKAEYGVYTYANNQLRFFLLLSGIGVVSGILQMCSEISENENKAKNIYAYGCRVGISFNILLAVAILLYSRFAKFPIENANKIMRIMCFLPLVNLLPQLQTTFLRSRIRNNEFAAASIIKAVLSCILLITGAWLFKILGLIIGTYLTSILTTIIVAWRYKVNVISTSRCTFETEEKRDLIKISTISMTNNAISELLYLLDIFFIAQFICNEEVIASYQIATVIPTALIFVPSSLITFIYPYFARHKDDVLWVKQNYIKVLLGSFGVDSAISIILIVIAPWLLTFLYGSQYSDAVIIFRVLMVGFAFSGSFRVLSGNLLVTQRELKFNTVVAVLSGVLNIIADIILIHAWGSMGAAIATVMVQLVTGLMNTMRMFHVLKRKSSGV